MRDVVTKMGKMRTIASHRRGRGVFGPQLRGLFEMV